MSPGWVAPERRTSARALRSPRRIAIGCRVTNTYTQDRCDTIGSYSAMSMRGARSRQALEHRSGPTVRVAQTVRTVQAVPDAQLGPRSHVHPTCASHHPAPQRACTHGPYRFVRPLPLARFAPSPKAVDTPTSGVMHPGDRPGRLYRRRRPVSSGEPVSWCRARTASRPRQLVARGRARRSTRG